MNKYKVLLITLLITIISCGEDPYVYVPSEFPDSGNETTISDVELLDLTQKETFKYFWDFAETTSGCARERYHPENPSFDSNTIAIGGTGFGLMSILVGMERNFISRTEGIERLTKMLSYLENADRFHGAWPHHNLKSLSP